MSDPAALIDSSSGPETETIRNLGVSGGDTTEIKPKTFELQSLACSTFDPMGIQKHFITSNVSTLAYLRLDNRHILILSVVLILSLHLAS